jgi:hypothetical protein
MRKIITHDNGRVFGFECGHCSHSGLTKNHEIERSKKHGTIIIKY